MSLEVSWRNKINISHLHLLMLFYSVAKEEKLFKLLKMKYLLEKVSDLKIGMEAFTLARINRQMRSNR